MKQRIMAINAPLMIVPAVAIHLFAIFCFSETIPNTKPTRINTTLISIKPPEATNNTFLRRKSDEDMENTDTKRLKIQMAPAVKPSINEDLAVPDVSNFDGVESCIKCNAA